MLNCSLFQVNVAGLTNGTCLACNNYNRIYLLTLAPNAPIPCAQSCGFGFECCYLHTSPMPAGCGIGQNAFHLWIKPNDNGNDLDLLLQIIFQTNVVRGQFWRRTVPGRDCRAIDVTLTNADRCTSPPVTNEPHCNFQNVTVRIQSL